jgi:hypothetical protein
MHMNFDDVDEGNAERDSNVNGVWGARVMLHGTLGNNCTLLVGEIWRTACRHHEHQQLIKLELHGTAAFKICSENPM